MNKVVVEYCKNTIYPKKGAAFRPSQRYPEYPDGWPICDSVENAVYDCVRSAFIRMEYDKENIGTKEWNPLKEIIKSGDSVLVKPNFVHESNGSGDTVECLYTQPGVIAAVVDYALLALGSEGAVIIGDAPMQDCNFDCLKKQSGLDELLEFYQEQNCNVQIRDFRGVITTQKDGVFTYHVNDNVGKIIDLSERSEFSVLSEDENLRLRKGANDPADLHDHHNSKKHEYEVCHELLQADVVIDMPKPKLHMKAGVTISLKNMVGINVRKEFLPHHMEGDKESGMGDAYRHRSTLKRIRSTARDQAYIMAIHNKKRLSYLLTQVRRGCALLVKLFVRDKLTEGTWYGNETISKTIVDLNKIVKYADKNGVLTSTQQRKRLIVADMIIAGELKGPLSPTAKPLGVIAVGEDSVCFDESIAALMGAKVEEIPTLKNARCLIGELPLTETNSKAVILSNNNELNGKTWSEIDVKTCWRFKPIDSWKKAFYVDAE